MILALASLIMIIFLLKQLFLIKKSLNEYADLLRIVLRKKYSEALKKMKKLRRRYIVFSIISGEKIDKKELEETLREHLERLYGIIGLMRSDPQIVYYDPLLKRGVIRVRHVEKRLVIAALSTIREINGKKVLIIPVKTTGTIKKAKKYMYYIKQG